VIAKVISWHAAARTGEDADWEGNGDGQHNIAQQAVRGPLVPHRPQHRPVHLRVKKHGQQA
jgi:hypothetical protein